MTLSAKTLEEIEKSREDKEEIETLAFYSRLQGECIAQIDEKLLEFWK